MQEENKNSTPGKNGSWMSFIFASICALPLAAFTFLHLIAMNYGMLTLLDNLRFCAAFFAPVFPIAALLALISSGFDLKQHPKMFPILTLYALVAIGHILAWVLILYWGNL
jgi:uncharacterized membrane protein